MKEYSVSDVETPEKIFLGKCTKSGGDWKPHDGSGQSWIQTQLHRGESQGKYFYANIIPVSFS